MEKSDIVVFDYGLFFWGEVCSRAISGGNTWLHCKGCSEGIWNRVYPCVDRKGTFGCRPTVRLENQNTEKSQIKARIVATIWKPKLRIMMMGE